MANKHSDKLLARKVRELVHRLTKPHYWSGKITAESKYPAYSKVTLDSGVELEVLNTRLATMIGKRVKVGYDPAMPGVMQVLGFHDPLITRGVKSFFNLFIQNHHRNHEYPAFDTVYSHGAQFMPLNVSFGDFEFDIYDDLALAEVTVYGEVLRADGQWIAATTTPLDISASVPLTPGARYVLIEVDLDGTIIATDGSLKADKYLLLPEDIPAPTPDRVSICAISVYENQTEIARDVRPGMPNDVVDLRWSNWNRVRSDLPFVIHDATEKVTIADDDEIPGADSEDTWALVKWKWSTIVGALTDIFELLFAPIANGVTNGDSHDHNGGDGAQIAHGNLSDVGTNNHATIDSHIASAANPHSVTAAQAEAIPEGGWIARTETWTRTGNYTFTISGDVAAIFRKGTKVRYKDGGAYEYGVVGSSSYSAPDTTVTLITNDDYAMAAATITDRYISFVENPEGFPHWFDFTPTFSANGSMTFTSVSVTTAKFRVSGNTVEVNVLGTGETGGTASTQLRATPPIAYDGTGHVMAANTRDATSGGAAVGSGSIAANGLTILKSDISNYGLGTGRIFFITGFYTF